MKLPFKKRKAIPNAVSILRALLGAIIPFFLFPPHPFFHWLGLFLFIGAAITDFIDGYLARSFSWGSNLGKILDPTADKILILAPLIAFAQLDVISVWWMVPIMVREITVTFCRIGWSLEGVAVGAEKVGKLKFVSQVTSVILSYLYYFSFSHPKIEIYRYPLNYLLMGSFVITTFLTLYSGVSFFLNNRENLKTDAFRKYCSAAGVGLIPFAPGTWGSGVGLILAVLCQVHSLIFLAVFLMTLVFGFWATSRMDFSRNADPHFIVMDEVSGMMLSLLGFPFHGWIFITGFFIFRFFDIVKPFPLRRLEKIPGYWGILLDDLGAGIYTWVSLFVLVRYFHG